MKKDLVKLHHARSAKDFPELKLEENEYIELIIKRSPIGMVLIWGAVVLASIILFVSSFIISFGNTDSLALGMDDSAKFYLQMIIVAIFSTVVVCGIIGSRVYKGNILYVTNKRLFQCNTTSLFSSSTNVIDLVSIEDASFKQSGILEYLFKIGTIRMATIGEETTYTFKYIDTPTDELSVISHLIHVEKEKYKSTLFRQR